jgi:hypothetical protein
VGTTECEKVTGLETAADVPGAGPGAGPGTGAGDGVTPGTGTGTGGSPPVGGLAVLDNEAEVAADVDLNPPVQFCPRIKQKTKSVPREIAFILRTYFKFFISTLMYTLLVAETSARNLDVFLKVIRNRRPTHNTEFFRKGVA